MKIIKKVRAPVRIDFAGGTTDISPFRDDYSGAVLNAAINHYVYGEIIATGKSTNLCYHADIPTSSGLGTSSAMNVVWLSLITHLKDRKKIAETAFKLEHSISESKVNGKQDMYAACFGGINFMKFIGDKVIVEQIKLKDKIIKELEEKLVLVYSGKSHLSGSSNKAMIDNLIKGKNTKELLRIREIAIDMRKALIHGDLNLFSNLMNSETEERAKLSKITLSLQLKEIIDIGKKNGARSAKICGSGGGGSILFFTENKDKLTKVFGNKIIDFKFDFEGLKWMLK